MQPRRWPFFYGWVIVAVAFVTMGSIARGQLTRETGAPSVARRSVA